MSKQIVSAVTVTAIMGALMIGLMFYASGGPVDPNMQVSCRGGEGGQVVAIADDDCTFIAKTLAAEARQSEAKTQAPFNSTASGLGQAVGPNISLFPLPDSIKKRVPSVAEYQYFVEGNNIVLVESQGRRVVIKVDIQQSKTP